MRVEKLLQADVTRRYERVCVWAPSSSKQLKEGA